MPRPNSAVMLLWPMFFIAAFASVIFWCTGCQSYADSTPYVVIDDYRSPESAVTVQINRESANAAVR